MRSGDKHQTSAPKRKIKRKTMADQGKRTTQKGMFYDVMRIVVGIIGLFILARIAGFM
jgi:hypothetical protein